MCLGHIHLEHSPDGDISDDNKRKSGGSDILKILFIYFKTVKQIDGSRNE